MRTAKLNWKKAIRNVVEFLEKSSGQLAGKLFLAAVEYSDNVIYLTLVARKLVYACRRKCGLMELLYQRAGSGGYSWATQFDVLYGTAVRSNKRCFNVRSCGAVCTANVHYI